MNNWSAMFAESTLGFWFIFQFQLACNLLPTCQHVGQRFGEGLWMAESSPKLRVSWWMEGREHTSEGKPGFHYVDQMHIIGEKLNMYIILHNSLFRVVVYFSAHDFQRWRYIIPGMNMAKHGKTICQFACIKAIWTSQILCGFYTKLLVLIGFGVGWPWILDPRYVGESVLLVKLFRVVVRSLVFFSLCAREIRFLRCRVGISCRCALDQSFSTGISRLSWRVFFACQLTD